MDQRCGQRKGYKLANENKILKGKISELNSDRKLATKDIKTLKKEVKQI